MESALCLFVWYEREGGEEVVFICCCELWWVFAKGGFAADLSLQQYILLPSSRIRLYVF